MNYRVRQHNNVEVNDEVVGKADEYSEKIHYVLGQISKSFIPLVAILCDSPAECTLSLDYGARSSVHAAVGEASQTHLRLNFKGNLSNWIAFGIRITLQVHKCFVNIKAPGGDLAQSKYCLWRT